MAVNRPDNILVLAARRLLDQVRDHPAIFFGHHVADSIGNVQCGRAFFNGGGADRHQIIPIGATCVHRTELDIGAIGAGAAHHFAGADQRFLARHHHLIFEVNI